MNAPRLTRLVEILDRLAGRDPLLTGAPKAGHLPPEVIRALELAEARDLARELLEAVEWRRLAPPPLETEREPRPLIYPRMWLLVKNRADGRRWRSSFVPEGWELLERPPLLLVNCLFPRLDHVLCRWERR